MKIRHLRQCGTQSIIHKSTDKRPTIKTLAILYAIWDVSSGEQGLWPSCEPIDKLTTLKYTID